jgi:hypothetical protein
MIRYIWFLFWALSVSANVAVTGDTYRQISDENVEIIYAEEYAPLSQKVLGYESELIKRYSDSYGYRLDDTQYVGLLSSHNQVANAFSTQMPLNLQMNFPAGSLMVDYFAGASWIKTILLHESAHNFQLNPKKNMLSYYAHKVVKNSFFTTLLFAPIFPVPNLAESSFMLEGNAVLNESWHNNGGRLYNGSLLAMSITQARAGYITPERTYNNHLYFPYATHHYIIGGFFQLFLAQKYGIDKVNSYFYNFSGQWIPIFTNAIFKETFGVDFESALQAYNSWLLQEYKDFKESQGHLLFTSKSSVKLGGDAEEIYFLTTDHLSAPTLVRINKKSGEIKCTKTAHFMGQVFKVGEKFYTVASAHISPEKIMVGLYDEEGKLLQGSASKALQGFLSDGKMVYFDIASSFDRPQMYIDGKFYAQVNSSVFTYHDRYYYFKQEGKTRTLYEDKMPLFSYKGWYGFVCDKDENGLYFIANSADGSTLYRYHDNRIERVSDADDIIDAKLLSTQKILVETMGADGVSFREISPKVTPSKIPEVQYFFEDDARFSSLDFKIEDSKESHLYNPLTNLHYSALSQSIVSSADGVDFQISAAFVDPLSQNRLSLFSSKVSDEIIAGAGYDLTAYRLAFHGSFFGVIDHDDNRSYRGFGTQLSLSYPLLQQRYEKMDLSLSYLLEDTKDEKEPFTLSLTYKNHQHFGHSMYINAANDWQLSMGVDRGDKAVGATYLYATTLADELYMALSLEGVVSDSDGAGKKRGIKLQQYQNKFSDALDMEMPSLSKDIFVKNVCNAGIAIQKVFNLDKYFFTFPISLRREALYGKYHYYNMEFFDEGREDFHEITLGVKADLLYFNSLALPISFEYIYNENLKNANNFRVLFDLHL